MAPETTYIERLAQLMSLFVAGLLRTWWACKSGESYYGKVQATTAAGVSDPTQRDNRGDHKRHEGTR